MVDNVNLPMQPLRLVGLFKASVNLVLRSFKM